MPSPRQRNPELFRRFVGSVDVPAGDETQALAGEVSAPPTERPPRPTTLPYSEHPFRPAARPTMLYGPRAFRVARRARKTTAVGFVPVADGS